jgi:hypothetical protein
MKSNLKAFSLLECLVASSLMLVIIATITQGMFIITSLNQKTEIYLKYLNNSQYLYWLFYDHITENLGVYNLSDELMNNYQDIFINKIMIDKFIELNKIPKIELLSTQEFIVKYNLSSNIQSKLVKNTSVVKISFLKLNSKKDPKKDDNINFITEERVYYVAQRFLNNKITYGLYQYLNNYSDELVSDVSDMQVREKYINNNRYFYFTFIFDNNKPEFANHNKIAFLIPLLSHA